MSLDDGFEPLDDRLRERYVACFTPSYWEDDVVPQAATGYINRLMSTMGRKGRRHSKAVLDHFGLTLVPQNPRAFKDGTFVPDDHEVLPGSVVKVISETVLGAPGAEVIEYLAEEAPGTQRFQPHAFDIRFEGPVGEQYWYHQEANWFMAETNAGAPAGISLFPLEIDYELSGFAGPYGDEGGTSIAVSGVNELEGIPFVHLGVHPSSGPDVHERTARVVVYDELLRSSGQLFVPDASQFM